VAFEAGKSGLVRVSGNLEFPVSCIRGGVVSAVHHLKVIEAAVLWGVSDVARFLCVSESWVYREAAANRLPKKKVGRSLRFIPDEIKDWLAKR
jgi:excisionase family DNA binding protein